MIIAKDVQMDAAAKIGDLNLIRGLDRLTMGPASSVGRGNWVYAIPTGSPHLTHEVDRRTELLIGTGAGMSHRHLLDCSNTVRIGDYSGLVGHSTQIITHQIDMLRGRQSTRPVTVGSFCMIGTRSILLGGAVLPDRSVLGAGSTLRSAYTQTQTIYSGVPAQATDVRLPDDAAFFCADKRDGSRRLKPYRRA